MVSKRLLICCALLASGLLACSEDSCKLTRKDCASKGMGFDEAGCSCTINLSDCPLTPEICAMEGGTFDAEECACDVKTGPNGQTCALTPETCLAMGQVFDQIHCQCISNQSGNVCNLSAATCQAQGKTFDAEHCQCVGGQAGNTCTDVTAEQCASLGMGFDPVECTCTISLGGECNLNAAECAKKGQEFDEDFCVCFGGSENTCTLTEASCASEGKGFDAASCSCTNCVKSVCNPSGNLNQCLDNGSYTLVVCEFGCENDNCKVNPAPECTENACKAGANNVLKICNNGKFKEMTCPDAQICDPEAKACVSSGGTVSCVADVCKNSSVLNHCDHGKIFEIDCPKGCLNNACVVDGQITEPVAGAACTAATYEGGCSADGTKRYYCNNEGKLVEKNCAADEACIVLGKNSSSCMATGVSSCVKETYVAGCSDDLKVGTYCTSSGKVVTLDCGSLNKKCINNAGFIKCDSDTETQNCAPGMTAYCNKICKADGSEGYYYSKGEVHIVACANNDCTTANGKVECLSNIEQPSDDPVVGQACNKDTYPGGCSADGKTRYYCNSQGKYQSVQCTGSSSCVVMGNNYSKCETQNAVDCAPGGTEYCNKVCKPDKSEGYFFSKGQVQTLVCPNNDCVLTDAGRIECASGSEQPSEEPVEGASCDPTSYEGGCSADGKTRFYCNNDSKLKAIACTGEQVCVVKGSNSSACEGAVADCAPGGTSYCNKVCKADKSEGYYYSKGEVHTVVCANNDCQVANGKVECKTVSEQPSDEPVVGESCDPNTYEGGCSADGKTRYYCNTSTSKYASSQCTGDKVCVVKGNNSSACEGTVTDCAPGGTEYCNKVCNAAKTEGYYYSKGEVHTVLCANHDCVIQDGRVECVSNSEQPADEPVAGASCDPETYAGGCSSDKKTRFYCNKNQLVGKVCDEGKVCQVMGNNSSVCSGGTSTLPDNVPETCIHHESKGICGTDGMPYVCGSAGEYYKLSCSASCFECSDNYWVGCGTSEALVCEGHTGE